MKNLPLLSEIHIRAQPDTEEDLEAEIEKTKATVEAAQNLLRKSTTQGKKTVFVKYAMLLPKEITLVKGLVKRKVIRMDKINIQ